MSAGNRADWNPRPATLVLVDAARDVIDEAAGQGYKLTLRAVYYGLVSVECDCEQRAQLQAAVRRCSTGRGGPGCWT